MPAPKRTSLVATMHAAKEAAGKAARAPLPRPAVATPAGAQNATTPAQAGRSRALTDASATTAIHIPRDDLALLRRVAVERANRGGGRPSVSDVLRDLIERHRAELEAEAER